MPGKPQLRKGDSLSESSHDTVQSKPFGLVICAFVEQFIQTIAVEAQFLAPVVV
jgi:hypothetical protein